MNQSLFQSPGWYHALTLTERIALKLAFGENSPNLEINTELTQKRIQQWREQSPFSQDSYWVQRLALDGVTEKEFLNLLGEPIEAFYDRLSHPPAWLASIQQAFTNHFSSDHYTLSPPQMLHTEEAIGFLYAVEPLISQGCDQLQEKVQSLSQKQSQLPFDSSTVMEILCTYLPEQLLGMINRTMILELNVARLQGLLEGDTSEKRFQSFVKQLQQRERALALLQEYPVLARQIQICIDHWVNFSWEFLQHLCTDWNDIQATFSQEEETELLTGLQWGAGDGHRGGRSVLIAKFSSGFQVVYKPRSLAVDVHFQELLTWLNHRGTHPPFKTLKVLDRGSYGWVEFVKAYECTTAQEVERFYQRQGGYLALLYVLEATDFHSENLIAVGEHPILVDVESLFHPRFDTTVMEESDLLVNNKIANSVLSVGLLPQRIWIDAQSQGIDMGGLSSMEGQLTPYKVVYWQGAGTDEMRVKRKRLEMEGDQNRPTLEGKEIDVLAYADSLQAGFVNLYRLFVQHREELLADNGPLAHFALDEVRVIIRDTHTYASLLGESFHPDVLRDALPRDCLFDRLWLNIEQQPYLAKVIAAERDDLWQGDIPLFTTRPHSRDIWSTCGKQIADFYQESGMTLVQHRLQQLSEADLTQQLWFICASLTTLITEEEPEQWPVYHFKEPQNSVSREQLLESAQAIGDRIETLALCGEKDASWIGLNFIDEKHLVLAPLGMDLYEGLPGMVLFLGYLGHLTKENRYTNLAKAALRALQCQIESQKGFIASIGGFEGWGGIIYTLTHLGIMWDDPELLTQAESLVALILPLIAEDEQFDIIGGSAGCIGSLINLYRCKPSPSILVAAIQCGDHLIAKAQLMESGIGWRLENAGAKPLTGFSHGTAGIAWALLELAALTGEERFRTGALSAIAYERSLFCPEVGNWLDLRNFADKVLKEKDNQYTCMTAWCNGAPGIGLARLRSLPYLDDAEIRAEINIALKTTLSQGFGRNHSLCHGDLGNLELLLQASQTLDDPYWKAQVDRFAAIILESIEKHGWLCGVPLGVETPGLMTGLAGIGYQLLRLAEPERVPSVLVLESPKLNMTVIQKAEKAMATR